ncbi:MAG: choice-of-anchor E domain-containing protein [Edaphobacter sp.]
MAWGDYGIDSTAIADFNTLLGTLNSVTIELSGEATNTQSPSILDGFNTFDGVLPWV